MKYAYIILSYINIMNEYYVCIKIDYDLLFEKSVGAFTHRDTNRTFKLWWIRRLIYGNFVILANRC